MNYSRRRGHGQRTYEPRSWAEEQEELKLMRKQQERAPVKPPDAAPQPSPPPART